MYNTKRALELLETEKICPHCGTILSLCEEPEVAFSDGLGRGGFLWICLNDECGCLETSNEFKDKFSKSAMTRYAFLPGEKKAFCMAVFSVDAYKNLVVSKEIAENGELERMERLLEKSSKEYDKAVKKYDKIIHEYLYFSKKIGK